MGGFIDLAGKRFGRLSVLGRAESQNGQSRWLCKCDCGKVVTVLGLNLKSQQTVSCGCWGREARIRSSTKHGMSKSREYASWESMKIRCTNPNKDNYKDYGGRGITVCDEWLTSFEAFYRDMGERPLGTTLDRIDVNGNYEPGNCRWATDTEQDNNRRTNHLITFQGKTQTITEWSRELNIPRTTILNRIKRSLSEETVLTI